jgi:hypothetical protein
VFPDDETPAQRSLRGRTAVLQSWAQTEDWTTRTTPGRRAFDARFDRQVDPDGVLAPDIRAKRAKAARQAYFAQLALKSAQARARKKTRAA